MRCSLSILARVFLAVVRAQINTPTVACPLLGQQYPPPVKISKEPAFQALTKSLDAQIDDSLKAFPFNETSFAVSIFSTSDSGLAYEYYHADAFLSKQNTSYGTTSIHADSIFRLGSVSKLLTMYTWLITDGDRKFYEPLANYIPQLQNVKSSWNSLTPDWSDIYIGDLAGQMGGVARDFGVADIAPVNNIAFAALPKAARAAFPPLPSDQIPKCAYEATNGKLVACSVDEYLQGVITTSPRFPTAYTPAYSNQGYILLGIGLANIAKKSLGALVNEKLVKPLGLKGTFYNTAPANTELGVIPGTPLSSGWSDDFGIGAAAGGFLSTTNDLATIGKAILNHTLIPQSQTNRWLKPSSFLESFSQGVGRPWEIWRRKLHGQSIDLYTKTGDWGSYHNVLVVVPAYNVGMTLLTAEDVQGATSSGVRQALPEPVFNALLPVLDDMARSQAAANFVGEYTLDSANSSITINANSTGLHITEWVLRGLDIWDDLIRPFGSSYRLLPNNLYSGNKVGFTGLYEQPTPVQTNETWLSVCSGWFSVDTFTYGDIPIGDMVFEVDGSGKAIAVEIRAFRETLTRKS